MAERTPILFLDTETTGLGLDDQVWEFAAIRREPNGSETEHHWFVEHDPKKCRQLPETFLADHEQRFPMHHDGKLHEDVLTRYEFADVMTGPLMEGRPHVVGMVPDFDMYRIWMHLRAELKPKYAQPKWHYHLIDVENLAAGWLASNRELPAPQPPWDSEELSRNVGVDPDQFERHTALGDAQWARAVFDAVMGAAS